MDELIRQLLHEREIYIREKVPDLVRVIEEELRQLGYDIVEIAAIQPATEHASKARPTKRAN
jgi:hypothetical protein